MNESLDICDLLNAVTLVIDQIFETLILRQEVNIYNMNINIVPITSVCVMYSVTSAYACVYVYCMYVQHSFIDKEFHCTIEIQALKYKEINT